MSLSRRDFLRKGGLLCLGLGILGDIPGCSSKTEEVAVSESDRILQQASSSQLAPVLQTLNHIKESGRHLG